MLKRASSGADGWLGFGKSWHVCSLHVLTTPSPSTSAWLTTSRCTLSFRSIDLARVRPFLLLAGSPEALRPYRDRVALLVEDVDEVAREIGGVGGHLLEGPMPGRTDRDS